MTKAGAFIALGAAALLLSACATDQPLAYEASTRLPNAERNQADRQLIVTIREAESTFTSEAGSTPRSYGKAARYQPSAYARRIVNEIARDYDLKWVAEWRIEVLGVHCVVFSAPDNQARTFALERLKKDKRVESVQVMQQFRTAAKFTRTAAAAPMPERTSTYNDPYYGLQWQVDALRVPEAQRWSRGRGVRVAVIDTGVDLQHPELAGRVRLARNFVDADPEAFNRDSHGTAVAGVIAAAINNGVGIIGVAPSVELLALKACWHAAGAPDAVCNTLTLAEALAYAIEHKAAVINLSLAGPEDPLLRRLVEKAIHRGTIVIGADAGLAETFAPRQATAAPSGQSLFPLNVPGVVAVSDGDPALIAERHARISAPGREVLTLAPSGRFDYFSGASLSSAMVSGIVALLLERHASLGPYEVATLLERTASPGSARTANACDAVAAIVQASPCADAPARQREPRVAGMSSKEAM